MGKDMTFYLFIGLYKGIIDVTRAFRTEKQAVAAFDDYTGRSYEKITNDEEEYTDFHEQNKNAGSKIEELQIEP